MKYIFLLLFPFCVLFAKSERHEFLIDAFPMIYYLEKPKGEDTFPIVILNEGKLFNWFHPKDAITAEKSPSTVSRVLLQAGAGLVRLEMRGRDPIKGNNSDLFFRYDTFSQRVKDHIQLIHHLREHPPKNWNGQLIILGDPGHLSAQVIKIAAATMPTACIVSRGWGDGSCQDNIWEWWSRRYEKESTLVRFSISWTLGYFGTRARLDTWCQVMKDDPDSEKFWWGKSYLYWADMLDQRMDLEFYQLKCPVLFFVGTEDVELESASRLVDKAVKNGQDITYIRPQGTLFFLDDAPLDFILEFFTTRVMGD